MMGYGYGMAGFGWLGSLLFIVLIVLGIVYLARALDLGRLAGHERQRAQAGTHASEDAALRILRERYARGEIDRQEFDQRRKDLS